MKKTILGVWGHGSQGKSTTVNGIYNEFLKLGAKSSNPNEKPKTVDVLDILEYKGVLIAFESQGDPGGRSLSSIPKLASQNPDIIICSSRTTGATVNIINNTARKNGYRVIWSTNHRTDVSINSSNTIYKKLNKISIEHLTELVLGVMSGKI